MCAALLDASAAGWLNYNLQSIHSCIDFHLQSTDAANSNYWLKRETLLGK